MLENRKIQTHRPRVLGQYCSCLAAIQKVDRDDNDGENKTKIIEIDRAGVEKKVEELGEME